MSRRSALRNRTEYAAVWMAVKSLELAPLPLANLLSRSYIWLLRVAIPRLRRVAMRNLALALPELGAGERAAIADEVFRSLARVVASFAKFPSIRRKTVDSWIRTEGAEYFEEALRQGRGVLFATAHLGNWELSAFAHALLTGPMSVVVRPLDNPLIDRLVERRRSLSGNRILAKKDYARGILKALAANQAVGVLIDQNVSANEGVFVDFFGMAACAASGFVRIAHHSGAAVIPGFALWMEDERRYVLRFYPAVPISGDAVADTQALQHKLQEIVREYPGQWLWIHRRWKTRPPGDAPLYEAI
ncbi:MAG TPA: lysophospholipid acyltransferase family protein [Verrucomicrobiae bacterium]|nr:lysophospholipid acyltransferase family protein [Verrucomicrobiae bacterium]